MSSRRATCTWAARCAGSHGGSWTGVMDRREDASMRFVVIAVALSSVALALVVHIAWWRWRRPPADIPSILALFLVVPAIAYAALASWPVLSPLEWGEAFVLHLAVGSAYIQTYPGAQARSPTLKILIALGRAPGGLDRAGIVAALDAFGLVGERLGDLHRNALAKRDGDRLVLTAPGKVLARTIGAYRRWLGLPAVGG